VIAVSLCTLNIPGYLNLVDVAYNVVYIAIPHEPCFSRVWHGRRGTLHLVNLCGEISLFHTRPWYTTT